MAGGVGPTQTAPGQLTALVLWPAIQALHGPVTQFEGGIHAVTGGEAVPIAVVHELITGQYF